MPEKVWLLVGLTCLMIALHMVAVTVLGSVCLATMLLSVGLILGCLLGIMAHYRRPRGLDDFEMGGLWRTSMIVGFLVGFVCLALMAKTQETTLMGNLKCIYLAFGYLLALTWIEMSWPPDRLESWNKKREEAVGFLRITCWAFFATGMLSFMCTLILFPSSGPGYEVYSTLSFLTFPVLLLITSCVGWDAKTLERRRNVVGALLLVIPYFAGKVLLDAYRVNFQDCEAAGQIAQGLLFGYVCALPILWRQKGHNAYEWTAVGLVAFIAILLGLRWMITTMPPSPVMFFLFLPLPALLIGFIWPKLPAHTPVRT